MRSVGCWKLRDQGMCFSGRGPWWIGRSNLGEVESALGKGECVIRVDLCERRACLDSWVNSIFLATSRKANTWEWFLEWIIMGLLEAP